jgi:hypothetical protein
MSAQQLNKGVQPLKVAGLKVGAKALTKVSSRNATHGQHAQGDGANEPKGQGVSQS